MEVDSCANAKKSVVMIAVDDSEHSTKALLWALENLHHCKSGDATVVLVHAESVGQVYTGAAGPGLPVGYYVTPDMIDAMKKQQQSITDSVFENAKRLCSEYHIHPKTVAVLGDAREGICDAAEKEHADVLVVGSHGYGTLKRTFLGSVSDYCAHHAKCPVVIVKKAKSHSK